MAYDWNQWVHDLIAAVIGGGASAAYGVFTVIVLDPHDFNPQTRKFYYAAGMMFCFGAATHLAAYLKDHPVPAIVSERKEQSVEITHTPIQGTGDGTIGNEGSMKKTVVTKVEEKVELEKNGDDGK